MGHADDERRSTAGTGVYVTPITLNSPIRLSLGTRQTLRPKASSYEQSSRYRMLAVILIALSLMVKLDQLLLYYLPG